MISKLERKDIRLAKSLSRILSLYDLNDEDLRLLKDVKDLKKRVNMLENENKVLKDTLNNIAHYKTMYETGVGEHLNDGDY